VVVAGDEFLDVGGTKGEGAHEGGKIQERCSHFAEVAKSNHRRLAFEGVVNRRK
jgi:hypothetical protein